ncbi:hypothetical protein Tco_0721899 [Tanacetum coccineum]
MDWRIGIIDYIAYVQPYCFIRDRFINREWKMQWKRPIVSGRINAMWEALQAELQHVTPFEGQDEVRWGIGHDGKFTVGATRHHIDDTILPTLDVSTMWCKILPKKVNIFLWRLNLDRLSHRLNLSRQGLEIQSISCPAQQNQNPEAGQTSMGRDGQIFMYNPDYLREQFAGLVIQRGLPFNHFDHEQTTRVFQNTLQPRYTHVSRSTLKLRQ